MCNRLNIRLLLVISCFQWFKDTKMKANHNHFCHRRKICFAVSNGSKILKWKQITTIFATRRSTKSCFQWFKDTKMKANHNCKSVTRLLYTAVSNGSKILKWKQITTTLYTAFISKCCFQWFKDTKMKANHNKCSLIFICLMLFPMVQRY